MTSELTDPALPGPALLRRPDQVRAAIVALPGAEQGERVQPLFEHLSATLQPLGYAVLSYDRRPPESPGQDTELSVQAADAQAAAAALRREIVCPVGYFGFSQGAWAASLAAAQDPQADRLAVVGCSGVTPAAQMSFYTDQLLQRSGYDDAARAQLAELRAAMEGVLRGSGDRAAAGDLLSAALDQPWFAMAYLPPELPPSDMRWEDMDFDPAPVFAQVGCPVLAMYGDDEECVPAAASKRVWRDAATAELSLVDLLGCGHFPGRESAGRPASAFAVADISADYTAALRDWYAR